MSCERVLENNTVSERDLGMERVHLLYENSKKSIWHINYFLHLLDRLEKEEYVNVTTTLQKTILDDLLQNFANKPEVWDKMAQRELNGFSYNDLSKIKQEDDSKNCPGMEKAIAMLAEVESLQNVNDINDDFSDDNMEGMPSIKVENEDCVWQKRTSKRRIQLCVNVYEVAVKTLNTQEMWTFYINAMLKLNQDMSTQKVIKRKSLAAAFANGHLSGHMSDEHYCTFAQMLLKYPGGYEKADSILSEVLEERKSLQLYEMWLSTHIYNNNEVKVYEIFNKANDALGSETFPLWQKIILYCKTRLDSYEDRLIPIYKKACQQTRPEFGVFRGEYLEFCSSNLSLEETRKEYDSLCLQPPSNLDMHYKMAEIESRKLNKDKRDKERWRLCYENTILYFGKTNSDVWIKFIKFELEHGDAKNVSLLHERAKNTLNVELVGNFITQYTLMTSF